MVDKKLKEAFRRIVMQIPFLYPDLEGKDLLCYSVGPTLVDIGENCEEIEDYNEFETYFNLEEFIPKALDILEEEGYCLVELPEIEEGKNLSGWARKRDGK